MRQKKIPQATKEELLLAQLEDARGTAERFRVDLSTTGDRLRRAEAEAKELRSVVSSLKVELANALTAIASLDGYISRVHEDDMIREGPSLVERKHTEEYKVRIGPQNRQIYYAEPFPPEAPLASTRYDGREPPANSLRKPWFDR